METAGVCLPLSVSPTDPPDPLSGVPAPSPTSHTRTDSGWAWLCPPESESRGPAWTRQAAWATVAHSPVLERDGQHGGLHGGPSPLPLSPGFHAGPCPASHSRPSVDQTSQVLAPSCGWSTSQLFVSPLPPGSSYILKVFCRVVIKMWVLVLRRALLINLPGPPLLQTN